MLKGLHNPQPLALEARHYQRDIERDKPKSTRLSHVLFYPSKRPTTGPKGTLDRRALKEPRSVRLNVPFGRLPWSRGQTGTKPFVQREGCGMTGQVEMSERSDSLSRRRDGALTKRGMSAKHAESTADLNPRSRFRDAYNEIARAHRRPLAGPCPRHGETRGEQLPKEPRRSVAHVGPQGGVQKLGSGLRKPLTVPARV